MGGTVGLLIVFAVFALLVRPAGRGRDLDAAGAIARTAPRAFIAWFGPKGVASMLFALFVLESAVGERDLIFEVAAFVILASPIAHGLTDGGSNWIERRVSGASGTSGREAASWLRACGPALGFALEALLNPLGRGDVAAHAQLLRLEAQGQADELGQVQHGQAEIAVDDLAASGCCISRFRWQSGQGVTRQSAPASSASPMWVPASPQRDLARHRDDREAAALAGAVVLHDLAAERLDQPVLR